ncbi:MAG: outer membrane lipoprotein-sorting protein [Spirochaetia bacterium]
MTKYKLQIFIVIVSLALMVAAPVFGRDAETIIRRMQENEVHSASRSRGEMITHDRFGTKSTSFVSYSAGHNKSLIEFTGKQERGQKILRLEDEIYLFYPDAEELIRMQGSALKDSVMGSDVSYEDMTGGKSLLEDYSVTLEGTETIDRNECYVVEMTAKSRRVPYYRQRLWVDTELYIARQTYKYSRSGDLLKEITLEDYTRREEKIIPTRLTVEDSLKSDSRTEFIIHEIEIGLDLDPNLFSLEELTW